MADFLLEFFSEEIPARMQREATRDLAGRLATGLQLVGLNFQELGIRVFVTPRRLALIADLPAMQAASDTELKGPKVGAPDAAVQGFLKKNNLAQSDLTEQDGVYFAIVRKEGRQTADILKTVIEDILANFPWPKSMRWGSRQITWVRPLHSILCLFDGKIVPVEFGGIKAGDFTFGHRFHAPEKITLKTSEEYEDKLKQAFVLADFDGRKEVIRSQANAEAQKKGLTVRPDERLLEEVTGLVEWPTVLMGRIDDAYMDLPPEVLISEMRAHQKYFALQDAKGVFSPYFLITSNNKHPDAAAAIVAGNERVLRARLSDGRFFWDQDRKVKLDDWAKKLEGITFHAKIGTVAQKVERVSKLAVAIADRISADKKQVERAAQLCKADLVTGMVGEFPELQGVMGRYYALHQGEAPAIADAIRDHYLPLGPDSPVPTEKTAICVALADKLDTLVSMFAAGEKPTGSKDPFALRRAALGVIRIILENQLRLNMSAFLQEVSSLYRADDILCAELLIFLSDRLKVILKDKENIPHDVITATLSYNSDDEFSLDEPINFVNLVARVKALEAFLKTTDGANLIAAAKRAQNIVTAEAKKDKKTPADYAGSVDTKLLKEAAEQSLYKELQTAQPLLDKSIASEDFAQAMTLIAKLRPTIDAFFDKVLVNDPDPAIRTNRLRLLTGIDAVLGRIADFSRLEG